MRSRGVTHLVGWFNAVKLVATHSQRPPVHTRLFPGPWQGKVRMAVYRIDAW
jgi:hypothetical protein